ncbi:polysialyltransferase family glycosyltransferase [Flavivirga amylovorans]|uniref:Polysialyltransferase family glycosyltransferase n=1 Tax=Flavivirga amylovorans TaxID=870486 RepID=A0ABT8X6V5_9FLAO|nr:polysialyltransferase family glycosyltransferase [Flavivirga amylovorans]MDO5989274.1 polysialyltransferase family glycosyltransferase [Flavivirga amylovorans]
MKNIFYIHSHITYFVAKGVIKYLGFNPDSLIYIISRSYQNDALSKSKCIDFTLIHNELDSFGVLNFNKKLPLIKDVDNVLKNVLKDEEFRVFLPHVFHPIMQIIGTNTNCKELHIIEEGVNAYSNYFMHFKEKSIVKGVVKRILNLLPFVGKGRIFFIKNFDLRKFKKSINPIFYTVTSKGFEGLPYEIVRVEMISEKVAQYTLKSNHVLVLEGAVEQGNLNLKPFLEGIKVILNDIKSDRIAVKFHPAQNSKNKDKILRIIVDQNKEVEVIPDNIAFEQIILNNPNLTVYGFATSLLFYAKEFGCKVKYYEHQLLKDNLFKEFRSKNDFNLSALLNES